MAEQERTVAEQERTTGRRARKIRHNGRGSQVLIYLGKQFRFFINQNDWKVLLMAGIIAGLVSMVIRRRLFINMEGSLIGAFALTCVALWNGCFNSIQAVCRERPIIKREHRSGMHISAYVAAHMIYQLVLCLLQTGLTVYVLHLAGIQFPEKGVVTPWMMLDVGLSMLLISYAADMMSLFLSSISHTTTAAMTLMPFVLIFQLVFSGGIIPLPAWSQPLSNLTISNYGIRALASQGGYNELPMVAVWNAISGMRENEIGGTYTVEELMGYLDSPVVEKNRDRELLPATTIGEAAKQLEAIGNALKLGEREVVKPVTARELIDIVLENSGFERLRNIELWENEDGSKKTIGSVLRGLLGDKEMQEPLDTELNGSMTLAEVLKTLRVGKIVELLGDTQLFDTITVGTVADLLKNSEYLQSIKGNTVDLKFRVGDIFDLVGEENIRNLIQEKTAAASYKAIYEKTPENVAGNWVVLLIFAGVFAILATIALELIDKDKR